MAILTFFFLKPFSQIKNRAIPIRIKRVVQAGAKSQLGGLKEGLFKFAYQVGIEGVVKIEPKNPAPKQSNREDKNLATFFILI